MNLSYEIEQDMKKLNELMSEFSLFPIIEVGGMANPIHRLIFCSILCEKYDIIKDGEKLKLYRLPYRKNLALFLGYGSTNSVKFMIRDNAINTIIGYKDYYKKYKIIKEFFLNENVYIKMKDLQKQRDDTQAQMTNIMNEILAK